MWFILDSYKNKPGRFVIEYDIHNTHTRNITEFYSKLGLRSDVEDIRLQINGVIFNGDFSILSNKYNPNDMVTMNYFAPLRGGFIMEVIEAVFALFKFMLMIPKLLIWIGRLVVWLIKAFIYLFVLIADILSKDGILGLIKFVTMEIIGAPFMLLGIGVRKLVNGIGRQTLGAVWGADNTPSDTPGDTPGDTLNSTFGDTSKDKLPSDSITCGGKRKCYKTPEGGVPFSVVLVTVLFPPAGVFMEYGLSGWLNILICLLLTFMFYFPGLIYALILMYC